MIVMAIFVVDAFALGDAAEAWLGSWISLGLFSVDQYRSFLEMLAYSGRELWGVVGLLVLKH